MPLAICPHACAGAAALRSEMYLRLACRLRPRQGRSRKPHLGSSIATPLCNSDFMDLGRRFGVKGHRVDRPKAIRPALRQAIAVDKPSLIEAIFDPDEEVSPW